MRNVNVMGIGLFELWLKGNESAFPPSASRFPEERAFTSGFQDSSTSLPVVAVTLV
jgi:hypothetical protein